MSSRGLGRLSRRFSFPSLGLDLLLERLFRGESLGLDLLLPPPPSRVAREDLDFSAIDLVATDRPSPPGRLSLSRLLLLLSPLPPRLSFLFGGGGGCLLPRPPDCFDGLLDSAIIVFGIERIYMTMYDAVDGWWMVRGESSDERLDGEAPS